MSKILKLGIPKGKPSGVNIKTFQKGRIPHLGIKPFLLSVL